MANKHPCNIFYVPEQQQPDAFMIYLARNTNDVSSEKAASLFLSVDVEKS
jgi:hypothetical protein